MVCAFQASRSVLSPACGLSVLLVCSAVVRNVGVFVTVPLTAPDFWYLGMSKQQQQQQHSSNADPAAMPTPLGLTSPQYWNLDTQMFLKVYTPHSDGTTIRSPSYTFCAAISVLCFIRSGPGLSGQLVYPSVVPAACACHL